MYISNPIFVSSFHKLFLKRDKLRFKNESERAVWAAFCVRQVIRRKAVSPHTSERGANQGLLFLPSSYARSSIRLTSRRLIPGKLCSALVSS